jgi:hypothetical protein
VPRVGRARSRPWPAGSARCAVALAALLPQAVFAQCQTIRFQPGASSAELRGTVQPEEMHCFRFSTGPGQAVRLAVKSKSGDVAFTIKDLVDNRDRYEFTSEKKRYELSVYQSSRSVTAEAYTLSLVIR